MKVAVFAAVVFLFLALTFSPKVQGDGSGYFAYLHTIVVDHDLNMADEYAAARAEGVHTAGDTRIVAATGLPANQFSVGPAILSLPFYLVALAIDPRANPQYAPPFNFAYTLASLLYGLLALALIYRWLRRLSYSQTTAMVAIAAVALATPFLFYAIYDPSYSHMFSAFMVTAFMYLWWSRRGTRGLRGWLALGVLGGLMALVRWQDAPLMAVTLLDLPRARWRLIALAPGAIAAFTPQLVVDEVIFGHLQPGAAAVSFTVVPGHYLEVLFSSFHGLFVWSPVLIAAVAGYWLVKDTALRAAFAICFAITLAIIGAFAYWYGGAAFGMRFFINLTPFFAIGVAALAARVRTRIAWLAIAALTAWNLLLVLSFSFVMKPDRSPGYVGLLTDQLRAIPYSPHLLQGFVVRSLVEGRNVPSALGLLTGEIVVVAAAVLLGRSGEVHPSPGSERPHLAPAR